MYSKEQYFNSYDVLIIDKRNLNLPISHNIFETNSSFHVNRALV